MKNSLVTVENNEYLKEDVYYNLCKQYEEEIREKNEVIKQLKDEVLEYKKRTYDAQRYSALLLKQILEE